MSLFAKHLRRLAEKRPPIRPADEPAKPRTTQGPPGPAALPAASLALPTAKEAEDDDEAMEAAEDDPDRAELLESLELAEEARNWPADHDGWPVDTIEPPPPCGHCGGMDYWLPAIGGPWRCVACCPCWKPGRRKRTR